MQNKIIIPPYTEECKYDNLCAASTKLSSVLSLVRGNSEQTQAISNLISEIDTKLNSIDDNLKLRMSKWSNVLEHYYKATIEKKTYKGLENQVEYIFPYQMVKENGCLFLVEIDPYNDYEAMQDHSINVETEWCGTVTLEEITKEEFLNQAKINAERIMERRLKQQEFYNNIILG